MTLCSAPSSTCAASVTPLRPPPELCGTRLARINLQGSLASAGAGTAGAWTIAAVDVCAIAWRCSWQYRRGSADRRNNIRKSTMAS